MAGDYKSYLIRASTALAFCIIWAQHFWCLQLQTQQAQTSQDCNVLIDTCCPASCHLRLIPSGDCPVNVLNWSSLDRTRKPNEQQKLIDVFATMHCQSSAEQPLEQKIRQNSTCIYGCPHDDDEDAVCHAESNPYAVDTMDYAQKFLESLYVGPMIPSPIMIWLVGIFELFDLILLLHAQDDRSVDQSRRRLHLILPFRLIRMFGFLLCFGLILQRGCHALLTEQLPYLHSSEYSKAKTKQKKCTKRQQALPDPFCSMFDTTTSVRLPDKQIKALSLHTVGDGNCMWRAIAKSNNMKWFHLKKKVIQYIADQQNPDYLDDLKRISKRNAWGNYFALTATASFLQKDIRVFTTQAIIDIRVVGSKGIVNLGLCNFHYSCMQNRSAEYLDSQCKTQFPQTMHHYLQQQPNLLHCIKHQQVYAQKNGSRNNYKHAKIEHQQAKTLHQQVAKMVAASKLPAYRPAGTPSGQRRPGEHFSEQIQRVAKARIAVPGGQVNIAQNNAAPAVPAKAVAGRLTPIPPPGPPPSYLRKPAEPAGPPPKAVLRDAMNAVTPTPKAPKAKPMPKSRFTMPRPSSAPNLLGNSGGNASSGSTELPLPVDDPLSVQPKAAGPPRFQPEELLIVSRGTRPECVQLTSKPRQLQDPSWDVILKSLHKLTTPRGTSPSRVILVLMVE